MPIGSVEHFSFLILSRSLTSKAWVSQKAESSCAETMGETPRTPSPKWQILYEIKHNRL